MLICQGHLSCTPLANSPKSDVRGEIIGENGDTLRCEWADSAARHEVLPQVHYVAREAHRLNEAVRYGARLKQSVKGHEGNHVL